MRLAPDILKLDRALTTEIDGDTVKSALVSSFVRYAGEIEATVCAEGIETEAELLRLAALDVAFGQGYLIARPAPAWAPVDAGAAETCAVSFRAAFSDMDGLTERIARAVSLADLREELPLMAEALGADEVCILPGRGEPGQLLAGDPDADPAGVAALVATGFRAQLTVPIGGHAHLHAYTRAEQPWTRFHIGRARMVSALLLRLGEGDRADG